MWEVAECHCIKIKWGGERVPSIVLPRLIPPLDRRPWHMEQVRAEGMFAKVHLLQIVFRLVLLTEHVRAEGMFSTVNFGHGIRPCLVSSSCPLCSLASLGTVPWSGRLWGTLIKGGRMMAGSIGMGVVIVVEDRGQLSPDSGLFFFMPSPISRVFSGVVTSPGKIWSSASEENRLA